MSRVQRYRSGAAFVFAALAASGFCAEVFAEEAQSPVSFGTQRLAVLGLLSRHEYAAALDAATALYKRSPDDLVVRGYLADAQIGLGNYTEALKIAQGMLNLRAGNVPGLIRAATLRDLHGDVPGALELLHRAYDSTPAQESADRAMLLTRMSGLHLQAGNPREADAFADEALRLVPGYPDALRALAQVRLAQGRADDAIALLEQLNTAAPRAANLFALAKALERAGRAKAAARAFAEFEIGALGESGNADNANHELVLYYVDHAHEPAKALAVATLELTRRHDAFTLDAYAWALAASGDFSHARTEIRKATEFGIGDPELLRHAREIEAGLR